MLIICFLLEVVEGMFQSVDRKLLEWAHLYGTFHSMTRGRHNLILLFINLNMHYMLSRTCILFCSFYMETEHRNWASLSHNAQNMRKWRKMSWTRKVDYITSYIITDKIFQLHATENVKERHKACFCKSNLRSWVTKNMFCDKYVDWVWVESTWK